MATGRELIGVQDATGEAGVDQGVEPHEKHDEPEHPEDPQRNAGHEGREDEGRAVDPHDEEHGERQGRGKRHVEQAQQHRDGQKGEDGLGAVDDVVVGHEEVAREAGHVVRRRRVGSVGRHDEEGQGQARAGVRRSGEPIARKGEQRQPGGRAGLRVSESNWSRARARDKIANGRAKLRVVQDARKIKSRIETHLAREKTLCKSPPVLSYLLVQNLVL